MSEWISAKKRLPGSEELKNSKDFSFLCFALSPYKGGGALRKIKIVKWNVHYKYWECDGIIITHWMPLPEPPEEGTT